MPLDDDVRAFLESHAAVGPPPPWETSIEEGRRLRRAPHLEDARRTPVERVEDRSCEGPAGRIPLRLYVPPGGPPHPLTVFFHGGGFVFGDLDAYDEVARRLCREGRSVVASVDYRLAPEAPFPAAVEDAEAATRWAAAHARELGGEASRLIVAGDSAGGNLAAVVSRRVRLPSGTRLAGQALIYPVTDVRPAQYASRTAFADGYGLTSEAMRWFGEQYAPSHDAKHHPDASPILATDLSGLPPAFVLTAEFDPLRDEGESYAQRLEKAGVPVEYHCLPGTIHGVLTAVPELASREEAWRRLTGWLRRRAGMVPVG